MQNTNLPLTEKIDDKHIKIQKCDVVPNGKRKVISQEDKPWIGWKYVGGRFFKPHVLVREGEANWGAADGCGECDACLSGGTQTLSSEVK